MKKTSSTGLLILSVVFLLFLGVVTFFMRDLIFGGVVATYEEAMPNHKAYNDQWISYEVVASLGLYAEETESYAFIPTGHEYYYMIWMKDGTVMPMIVSKKADKDYLESLTNATYDYLDGKTKAIEVPPREFIGTVKSQKSDAEKYYKEGLDYLKISEKDGWKISHVVLDCTDSRGGTIAMISVLLLLPIGCIALAIVNIKKERRKSANPQDEFLPK